MGKYVNGVYVPDVGETDNRNVSSVQPHSRPVETQNTGGVNPYADRAAAQAAVNQPAQPAPVQQPNLFAQQKQAYQASPQAKGVGEIPTKANVGSKPYTVVPREGISPTINGQSAGSAQGKSSSGSWKPINPNSDTDGMDTILGHFTSPQEEEKYRKASVAQQRILAVADAIRQIGNIYNTTRYAPSQKLNTPVETVRQRYLQDKALRDQANQRIMTYQMAKQKQDLQAKQWEADYGLKVADAARKAGATEAQIKNMQERLAEERRRNDLTHGLNKERFAWQKERGDRQDKDLAQHRRVIEGQNAQRINLQKQKLEWQKSGGGNGSNVPSLDTPNGKIQPSGRNYGNQLLQMWDYAKESGLVSESDVQKALREAGFGNETPDNVKRQQVLSLLRTNKLLGDYAINRLGWSSGGASGGMNLGLDDEDDDMDLGLD